MADRLEYWTLTALVGAAVDHDDDAWNELVRRFAGLVAGTVRRYRLSMADAQDVSQLVWLRLVEHLSGLREPAALPGWLATTTRHECERHLRTHGRSIAVDPLTMVFPTADSPAEVDAVLLATERRQVLLDGLAQLTPAHRE